MWCHRSQRAHDHWQLSGDGGAVRLDVLCCFLYVVWLVHHVCCPTKGVSKTWRVPGRTVNHVACQTTQAFHASKISELTAAWITTAGVAAYVRRMRTDVPELQDLVAASGGAAEGEEGAEGPGGEQGDGS